MQKEHQKKTAGQIGIGCDGIQKCFVHGVYLPDLKNECENQLQQISTPSLTLPTMIVTGWHETISMIIAKPGSTKSLLADDMSSEKEFLDSMMFFNTIQSFWLGHHGRCLYFAQKMSRHQPVLRTIQMHFYGAISCFHGPKKYATNRQLQLFVKEAMEAIKGELPLFGPKELPADLSDSRNYLNKLLLLEAEVLSTKSKDDMKARTKYIASITRAKAAKLIHEEGLAYELAALHCIRNKDTEDALQYFQKALSCYELWGSQLKVDSMKDQLKKLQLKKLHTQREGCGGENCVETKIQSSNA
jgi:hypothetical protein